MSCYECLRKKTEQEYENYVRLKSYFNAIENNKVEEYHKKHGRR